MVEVDKTHSINNRRRNVVFQNVVLFRIVESRHTALPIRQGVIHRNLTSGRHKANDNSCITLLSNNPNELNIKVTVTATRVQHGAQCDTHKKSQYLVHHRLN